MQQVREKQGLQEKTIEAADSSVTQELTGFGQQAQSILDESLRWLRNESLTVAVGIGIAALIFFALMWIRRVSCRWLVSGDGGMSWRHIAGRVAKRTHSFFLAAVAAQLVTRYVAPPGALLNTISFLFTIAAVIQGAIWVRELILALVERRAGVAQDDSSALSSAMGVIRIIVNVVVWALAIILVLDNLGVNVTALVAGLGIGGIAIGLAAQGIFSDLFAALAILFDRPFRRGDAIAFGTANGTVEAIGLKTTRIRSLTGEQIIVSNTKLLEQEIRNNQRISERRVVMQLGLIYQTDVELLARVPDELKAIVEAQPHCRFDRAHLFNFGPSSLDYELVFHVEDSDYGVMMDERQAICLGILRRFAELGIDFAYPSQTSFLAGPDGRIVDPHPPLYDGDMHRRR